MTHQLAYPIAQQQIADLHRTAEQERLARTVDDPRARTNDRRLLTRMFARLSVALKPAS